MFAERIRSIVEQTRFECDGYSLGITVSIGVATLACCGRPATTEELLALADRRMYEAKAAGRNRSVAC
jgi:diguanylate cyclase (GGDEF)-like protein